MTEIDRQFTRVERLMTVIRAEMAENHRVLMAKLDEFIDTQVRINRDVESRLLHWHDLLRCAR